MPSWKAFTALCGGAPAGLPSAAAPSACSSPAAWRPPCRSSHAGSLGAQSASTAATPASLQETASSRICCACLRSRSTNSRAQAAFWSTSCTRSLGGLRATVASMGRHWPPVPPGPGELQSTLDGLPRQSMDFMGSRSRLPKKRSSTKSRPKARQEATSRPGSKAAVSFCMFWPCTNCMTSIDCFRPMMSLRVGQQGRAAAASCCHSSPSWTLSSSLEVGAAISMCQAISAAICSDCSMCRELQNLMTTASSSLQPSAGDRMPKNTSPPLLTSTATALGRLRLPPASGPCTSGTWSAASLNDSVETADTSRDQSILEATSAADTASWRRWLKANVEAGEGSGSASGAASCSGHTVWTAELACGVEVSTMPAAVAMHFLSRGDRLPSRSRVASSCLPVWSLNQPAVASASGSSSADTRRSLSKEH
mmetsp:Transcript_80642/g.228283  ORF Transcript_80642/g.228283 Transcript_80642/m.228283 type:complete len:424 (-) Transcript_80642:201-1472(-)